ncbi:MAG: VCBS repeat-containing protein [Blastocatellia bacterium]|nr:VCBS repeat-containing protein [Blastocatellia bacterium]
MRSLVLCLVLLLPVISFGATKTWTGAGGDANWGTAANWTPSGVPAANDDLVFPVTALQQSNNNNTSVLTTYRSITVEGGTYTIGGNLLRLTNGLTVNGGTQTFNFPLTLSAPQTIASNNSGTATILILSIGSNLTTIDGSGIVGIGLISGNGGIIKNGPGAGAIISAAGFSGPITLNNGIFVVDANIPSTGVTVNNPVVTTGGLAISGFGGTGTVGSVNVVQGAVSAGTLTSPTGILTISNGLTFTANGTFACKLGGTTPGANGHDQLNVTGTVSLNNALLAPIPWAGFRPAIGDSYVILRNDSNDPINGTFLNLPNNSVFSGPLNTAFKITYNGGDGNDIAIQVVPRSSYDFDGDGKSDISIYRPSTTTWWYQSSINSAQTPTTWGTPTDVLAPADYDGDKKADVAVFRPSNGTWYTLNSSTITASITQFGASGDKPMPNDFDGDGRADIAVFRPSDGGWYQIRSLTTQVFIQQFGLATDIPQLFDYDGDGFGDLSVFRPSDGTWHFLKSSDNAYTAFPFGLAGDKPVPADYDGDGRTDVAVFRATSDPNLPDFYILTTNTFNYYGLSWGVPNDLPSVGDYDGDGKADVGIFRPSTNEWYLLRSTAGLQSAVFGLSGDKPIPTAYLP